MLNVRFERPGGNHRFLEHPHTKNVRQKRSQNLILHHFRYKDSEKFLGFLTWILQSTPPLRFEDSK